MINMQFMIWLGIGVAAAFAWIAMISHWRRPTHAVAGGLLVAALIYVGFAVVGGAGSAWIGIEVAGVFFYGVFAWLGLKYSPYWLAAGWALHIIWDVWLHQTHAGHLYTPDWYPPLCLGFDLAVAAILVAIMAGWSMIGVSGKALRGKE